MGTSLKRDFLNAFIILIIASAVGIVTNVTRTPILNALAERGTIHSTQANKYRGVKLIDDWSKHKGWPGIRETDEDEEADGAEIGWIDYYEVNDFYEKEGVRFFDARVPEEYKEGHIPNALPWPFNEFLEYLEKYQEDVPFDMPIVVYCEGGDCDQSNSLAENLLIVGYTKIYIYQGGLDEWVRMGHPAEKGDAE